MSAETFCPNGNGHGRPGEHRLGHGLRVIGGLMAYWAYQHLGNLSPQELAKDETYQRVCETRDGSAIAREMATRAESDRAFLGSARAVTSARPG